jgi:hypothetical protein
MTNQNDNGKKDVFIFEYPLFQPNEPIKENSYVDLGITPLAKQLGFKPEQTNGHCCGIVNRPKRAPGCRVWAAPSRSFHSSI